MCFLIIINSCIAVCYSLKMNDRRGHRKLRLTSRKNFKPKPKRAHDNMSTELLDEAPVKSIGSLQSRIQGCQTIPSGMSKHVPLLYHLGTFVSRMEY